MVFLDKKNETVSYNRGNPVANYKVSIHSNGKT